MPFCLLPTDGGSPLVIAQPVSVLGRSADCEGVVRGYDTVSRRHCEVENRGHFLEVRDLGSKNGVRINGHRIQEPTALSPGDRLRIGGAEFVLALRSDETIAYLQRYARNTEHVDPLSMTQPLSLLRESERSPIVDESQTSSAASPVHENHVQDDPKQHPVSSPLDHISGITGESLSHSSTRKNRQRRPADGMPRTDRPRTHDDRTRRKSPKTDHDKESSRPAKEFSQQSWDTIVSYERRAPEVKIDRPQKSKTDDDDGALAETASTLGYAVRARGGPGWNTTCRGLTLIQWTMIPAGLLLLLLWTGSAAGFFAMAARTCASVFVPFQTEADVGPNVLVARGLQTVMVGSPPLLALLFSRTFAEEAHWPIVGCLFVGVFVAPVLQPSRPPLVYMVYGVGGIGALLLGGLTAAGLLVASRIPQLPRLALRGVIASIAVGAALLTLAIALFTEKQRLPTELLPVATSTFALVAWLVLLTSAAALLLILYHFNGIADHFADPQLVESIGICIVYVIAVAITATLCWHTIAAGTLQNGWADVVVAFLGYGTAGAIIWVGQSAGHVRDAI